MCSLFRSIVVAMAVVATAACERESRPFHVLAPASSPVDLKGVPSFEPGPADPAGGGVRHVTAPPSPSAAPDHRVRNPYEANAYGIAQGQRLFTWMNCTGCHAHGGGAIGPPLIDSEWVYGGEPQDIFTSIAQGRPNGMPAYGERLNSDQIWQLAAYVQALSGHVRYDAAPGRVDHMHVKQRELAKEAEPIVPEGNQP